jgi:hydrogenase maturation protease
MLQRPILIIGIGNSLRSDDGVGVVACEQIDRLQWPAVSTLTTHQLFPETMLAMEGYATVIILDAEREGDLPRWQELEPSDPIAPSFSHQFDSQMLQQLQYTLQGKKSDIYLCGIPGEQFDHGSRLSPKALLNLQKAIAMISGKL